MKLSIIIPVYNVEEYVERCFNSVRKLEDTKLDYEVIFVNDGSTDNSLSVINKIAEGNSYVRILSQENQGLSGARNTGIEAAKGKYFLLLDSDDWLNFNVIKKLLDFTISNDLDILSYGLEYFDENYNSSGIRSKHPIEYNKILEGKEFLIQGYQPSSSCLFIYNTNFIKHNNLSFHSKISQQDVEFTIRMMLKAKKVYFSEETGYNYYRHLGTISLPKTVEKLHKYLSDAIIVASLIKSNVKHVNDVDKETVSVIEKNYNSVVWNLLWRFYTKPKEVDFAFKIKCLKELKEKELYPIKGELKTNFQNFTRVVFNVESVFKFILKLKSY